MQSSQEDVQIFDDSDRFWDLFWQHIDKAEDHVLVTTYDMDHKLIASITLQKLAAAAKRGCLTVLIIDDLNYYASQKAIQTLKNAGGIVIRNNPFEKAYEHVLNGRYQKFFNRNHQKVMLIDQHVFCGSLNVADPYSGARYGDGSFRDLNILLRNQDARSVRAFFLDLLIQNDKLAPGLIKIEEIIQKFAEIDIKYNALKYESESFKFEFLEEMPPKKTEVTSTLLDIINKAEKSIKIIQPYVQNVDEIEHALFEAIEKRGVDVEIITARKRDQPIYKSFLNSDLFSELIKKGVRVYEEPYKYLHMKAVEVDDGKYITIGSLNQDHCSFYQNNEANVLVTAYTQQEYFKQFSDIYRRLRAESRRVDPYEKYSYAGYFENKFWRISLFFIKWFCINREIRIQNKK